MLKSYLKITLRLFAKNRIYFMINALGLGIALACCITVYLMHAFNLEFNDFHNAEKIDNTYRIQTEVKWMGDFRHKIATPLPLAPLAIEEIAGIKSYNRYVQNGGSIVYGEKGFRQSVVFTDSTFFEMFDVPLLAGDFRSFKDPSKIFLSEDLADKLFGEEEPIGKAITINFIGEKTLELEVGGVLGELPLNNSFSLTAVVRFEHFSKTVDLQPKPWGDWRDPTTFVTLEDGVDPKKINEQLDIYKAPYNEARDDEEALAYRLVPFHENLPSEKVMTNYLNSEIDKTPLTLFTILAALILIIACFNLTNTTIALNIQRLKEIGIRKTIGAARSQIISQFLSETFILMACSLLIGFMASAWLISQFGKMFSFGFGLEDLKKINLFVVTLVITFIASLIAGIYPALFNSSMKPVNLMNGKMMVKGTSWVTRVLVGAQFAISVVFLIAGLIFYQNIKFQGNIDYGYAANELIGIDIQGPNEFELMENAMRRSPKIKEIGVTDTHISFSSYSAPVQVKEETINLRAMGVGKNYLETVGINLVQGNSLNSVYHQEQEERERFVLVNQKFIEVTGMDDPIGKQVTLHGKTRRIIGVVENHLDDVSRASGAEPFIYYTTFNNKNRTMLIRTEEANIPEVMALAQSIWKDQFPTKMFDGWRQDERIFNNQRELNSNLGTIFLFLTLLGTLLSTAGIFSLASLNVGRKTKEIGIRKVLGASVQNIVHMVNREFVIILLSATFIGAIGGSYFINQLLDSIYAMHIGVGVLPVILGAILIFTVGFVTTGSTILRAANANPVNSLRDH